jgi:hypothetical protein
MPQPQKKDDNVQDIQKPDDPKVTPEPKGKRDDNIVDPKTMEHVTPGTLKSLMAARDRRLKKDFDSIREDQQKLFSTLEEKLSSLSDTLQGGLHKDDDGDKQKSQAKKVSPEFLEMKRNYEKAKKDLEERTKDVASLRTKERDFRFETKVKNALGDAGCTKIEPAFKVIRDDLQWDENEQDLFAIVQAEEGEVEMDVNQFVKEHVAEKVLPEFFNGKHRPGSPASGGSPGGNYEFTHEQISDPNFYAANREKIVKALDEGRVKGA